MGEGSEFGGGRVGILEENNKKTPTKPLKTQHKPNTHVEEPKPRTYEGEPQSHARRDACPIAGKVTKAKAAVRGVFPAFSIMASNGDIHLGLNVGP